MMNKGKIYVVGIGPGNMEDISVRAYKTLKNVDIIAGYTTYVDLVKDEFKKDDAIEANKTTAISAMNSDITSKTKGATMLVPPLAFICSSTLPNCSKKLLKDLIFLLA